VAVGRVDVGSSRGRIGNTIVGTGFEGSFVPCAKAAGNKAVGSKPAEPKLEMPKPIVKNSIDARIVLTLERRRPIRWILADGLARGRLASGFLAARSKSPNPAVRDCQTP
jgi:hypothetical protein